MSYVVNKDGVKETVPAIYIQKYYQDIFDNLLYNAYDVGLVSHNERFIDYISSRNDISSFYIMTLSILADSVEDVYYDMTDVYNSDKIMYAIGEDLDDIGDKLGCPRPQSTRAGVELTFTLNSPYEVTVPLRKNLLVSNNKNISYYTVEEVNVPIGETEVTVFALAVEPGIKYRVEKETLKVFKDSVILDDNTTVGISVTNKNSSSGGRDAYSDEEYRELLLDWVKSNIKGSREAFVNYFANVDGLDSYKLVPNWQGITGTVKVVLDPGEPYQLKECYDDLNGGVTQFSEDIVMFPPDYVPIDIYAVCDVDIDVMNPYSSSEKASIKARIEEAIVKYIDGDLYSNDRKEHLGLEIGEDFIPYKLGVYISQKVPELKNIAFKYPVNPITITDEQLGKSNEITIEMGNVSDYYKEYDIDGDKVTDYIGWKV